jgi:hypothetical protein
MNYPVRLNKYIFLAPWVAFQETLLLFVEVSDVIEAT